MSLATLQERTTQLVLQRSQGKDIVEQAERELGATQFAIRELTTQIEEQKKAAEAADKEAAEAAEAELFAPGLAAEEVAEATPDESSEGVIED